MRLEGIVTTGTGKGRYYMSKEVYQEAFNEKLGFRPFHGTLNLQVDERDRKTFEKDSPTRKIRDVYEDGQRLSDVDITPCRIKDVRCGLLNLEITDHPVSIGEVVAPINLRQKFNLEDGDKVVLLR